MNFLSMLFAFLGVCVVVIVVITIYLDKTNPRDEDEPAEKQKKEHVDISKLKENLSNNSSIKLITTVIQLMAAGFAIWIFASFMASTFGTKGAKAPNCTGSGYTKICD